MMSHPTYREQIEQHLLGASQPAHLRMKVVTDLWDYLDPLGNLAGEDDA